MCLFFHNWSETYEIKEDLSPYQDIVDDPAFPDESRRLAKLFLATSSNNTLRIRKCLDCDYMQKSETSYDCWVEYKPLITKSHIRDFRIKKILGTK